MNCPHCGSRDTVVAGVCVVCGRRSKRGRRLEPYRRECQHTRVDQTPTPIAGEVRERCLDCGTERQVER